MTAAKPEVDIYKVVEYQEYQTDNEPADASLLLY